MTLVTRDSVTGLRRSGIHHPDGHPPVPSSCRWCGVEERCHGQRWTPPTTAQIKARMLARRAARTNPKP